MDDQSTTFPIVNDAARALYNEPHTCSLCGQKYLGWGNNPEPLRNYHDRCCDACNQAQVIPWRMKYGRSTSPYFFPLGFGKHVGQEIMRHAAFQHLINTMHTERRDLETIDDYLEEKWFPKVKVEPEEGAVQPVIPEVKPPKEDDLIWQAVQAALDGPRKNFNGMKW